MFFSSPWAAEIGAGTRYIYPLSIQHCIASVFFAIFAFKSRFWLAFANALFGKRESWRARLSALCHFFVACQWARTVRGQEISLIHAQWVHSSGSVGMYGAWLLGKSFSFTGHAADLFRERVALRDKIRRADFIVCISEFHRQFFLREGARPEQLHIVYCGINVHQFAPKPQAPRDPSRPLQIRASGRLVEKKGFAYLIEACKLLLDRGANFECVIAGSGPLQSELETQAAELGLAGRVRITGGEIKQEDIPAFMHDGDVYCLPCVWASDNDVDGLPQMLMEAMSCGLPAISTRLVGIPDLVIHENTGLLVEPGNSRELADAIDRLRADPELASRLARQGRQHCIDKFDIDFCLEPLIEQFRLRLRASKQGVAQLLPKTTAVIPEVTG
jgi:glycosyltransferase involved in cell wall biosynthesis